MPENQPLAIGPAPAEAAAAVILMHGRGSSPENMRALAEAFALPAVRFVLPAAPGGQWYPERFLVPIARNEPFLSRSLAAYEAIVAGLIAGGMPAERIVVGGFSQGACLTAEFLVRHPRRYAAALVLTGGLIGPPGTRWPTSPALAGVPIYLTGSKIDEWVPAERVEETLRVFRDSGAAVTLRIFDDRPHQVSNEEFATAREMLARIAASSPARKAGDGG
jgi:phospholipase/carboxylesterase